jgi:hypothetical protein
MVLPNMIALEEALAENYPRQELRGERRRRRWMRRLGEALRVNACPYYLSECNTNVN